METGTEMELAVPKMGLVARDTDSDRQMEPTFFS